MMALASIVIFAGAGGLAIESLIESFLKAAQHLAIVQPYEPHE